VRARAAYDRGTIAYRGGDFARAAAEYAMADQLMPRSQVLESALDCALLADDPVLGGDLVERASQHAPSERLATLVAKARTQFVHRTGRVLIGCNPERPCLAAVDGVGLGERRVARVRV